MPLSSKQPCRVLLIGHDDAGKTILCKRLSGHYKDSTLRADGVDLMKYKVDGSAQDIHLDCTDTKNDELDKYRDAIVSADGFVLIFNTGSLESFMILSKFLPQLWTYRNEQKFPLLVVGHLMDEAAERLVSSEEADKLAMSWHGVYVEITPSNPTDDMRVVQTIIRAIRTCDVPKPVPAAEKQKKNAQKKGCCVVQ